MLIEVNSTMWVNFEVIGQRQWAGMGAEIEFMYCTITTECSRYVTRYTYCSLESGQDVHTV